jgi:streptogrisin B
MRIIRTTLQPGSAMRARLITLAAGLGLATSALTGPAAVAEPEDQTAGEPEDQAAAESDEPTTTELATAYAAVGKADVPGLAWYTDPATSKVVITADSTVSAAELKTVRLAAGAGADADTDALTFKRAPGEFTPLLGSGDAIYGPGVRCSAGFNVVRSSRPYLITAGHCGNVGSNWHANSARTIRIGWTIRSSFPGNDYSIIRYSNPAMRHPGGYTAGTAYVGQRIKRDGSTTGVRSGIVTALNVSVMYPAGVVSGLIQTTACAGPGDSGGPMYSGSKALGITSGGNGSCSSRATTFFQPVKEVLKAYGVTIY